MSRFERYLNENWVANTVKKISNITASKAKKTLKHYWEQLKEIIQDQGKEKEFLKIVNKHLEINANSLDQLEKQQVKEEYLNEDFKHYWEWIKDNAFPTMMIFPGLSIFMELDKLFDNPGNVDIRKIIVYAVFFLIVATGSHIKQWDKWRKENPKSYSDEGEPGPFTIKRLNKDN